MTAGLLGLTLLSFSCFVFQKRPWSSPQQRTSFMLKMTAALVDDVPDRCIDELQRRLHGEKTAVRGAALSIHPLAQDIGEFEDRSCEQALASCGTCHLPKSGNNCNYEVHYGPARGSLARVRGQVTKVTANSIEMSSGEGGTAFSIPRARLHKTLWLDGADPMETWWDFGRTNARGEKARRMLELATENDVACVNCHIRHGDFGLTKEGKHFKATGEVIRRVPLGALR